MAIGRVLVIEDEAVAQFLIRRLLNQRHLAGEMVFTKNGKEGLEAMRDKDFDLILLDVNMPVMGGFEFLDALTQHRADGGADIPPIFLLTSSSNPNDKAKASQYPILKGYLTKPFSREHVAYLSGLFPEGTEQGEGL